MATDIFQMLVDILKINQNLISEYASQGPLYQMFYLFVFPTIFLVVFVYILTSRWMGEHRGLKILISVAVYAFIILQGYYSFFVTFSKYWLFGLLILGGLWMLFRPGRGGGGQGPAHGKVIGKEGLAAALGKRVWTQMSGEVGDLEKVLDDEMRILEGLLKDIRSGTDTISLGEVYRSFTDHNRTVNGLLEQYRQMIAAKGLKIGGKYSHFLDRYRKLSNEINSEYTKKAGSGFKKGVHY